MLMLLRESTQVCVATTASPASVQTTLCVQLMVAEFASLVQQMCLLSLGACLWCGFGFCTSVCFAAWV
jgi:hypothetical protein